MTAHQTNLGFFGLIAASVLAAGVLLGVIVFHAHNNAPLKVLPYVTMPPS